MQDFEILSPVKDEENFYQAINNGADAVYLGLTDFNARQKASTFNKDNLVKVVNFAHLIGVKVYVTLNTILIDEEFSKLIQLVKMATDAKVDAFIIQDLGVAKVLKSCFKNIVIHASTQLGVHNLAGAKVCEKLGFSRVVLSREATLEDIKQIRKNTNLEIEYFVQGALCVSFSGACYLSSLKHDCSGNRGKCLQLCRLCYSAQDKNINKKGYFLSPADLSFLDSLKDLYDAGVTSFKIEGRLRRPSYVALSTKVFAHAKDCILNNKKIESQELKNSLKKVFYRGEYNDGLYFKEEPQKQIINPNFQNHRGVLIGKVISTKPFKDIFEILLESKNHIISKNDGLKFVNANSNELSMGVGSVKRISDSKYTVYSKVCPKPNDEVYLTVDSEWENSLLSNKKFLDFDAYFIAKKDNKPKLILTCKQTCIEQELDFVLTEANSQALTELEVKDCLLKTNNMPFKLQNLECIIDNIFLPKSKLNELRRIAFEKLFEQINLDYQIKNNLEVKFNEQEYLNLSKKINENNFKNQNFICLDETICFSKKFENESLKYIQNNFVLCPSIYEGGLVNKCFKKAKELGFKNFYLDLPKVARKKDFDLINKIILSLPQEIGLIANNIYALNYCFDKVKREIVGGAYLNIANSFSAKVLNDFNIKYFVKSFEGFASNFNKGIAFEGKPALMTFCHCPYKTIYQNSLCKDCRFTNTLKYKNEAGEEFEIRRTKIHFCTFELVDTKPILQYNKSPKYINLRGNF